MSDVSILPRRIYAIGDIHGVLKPLQDLHTLIAEEERKYPASTPPRIIYMGDYIDRGAQSKQVVDCLIEQANVWDCIFLKGNHEHAMLRFLEAPEHHSAWLKWGGVDTLTSYGIEAFSAFGRSDVLPYLAAELKAALPPEHVQFYQSLKLLHEEEGYVFVHAGLRAGVAIEEQKEFDLLTIRDEFIYADYDYGKPVVFGHTIFKTPYHRQGRIGIDTGSYLSGRLTCAVLEGKQVRFITTHS